jgi:ribosomal-protein-alanine N-acetyltransferase
MTTGFFYAKFPIINIFDNFVLRELRAADSIAYFRYMNDENVAQYIASYSLPKSISHAIEELRYWGGLFPGKKSIYWGIAVKDTNELIGTIGYNNIWHNHHKGELSYDLDFAYWGQGIMAESLSQVLKFSQDFIGLVRVQATIINSNTRSIKLLEKLDFICEGLLQKYEYLHNEFRDSFMYAKILSQ